MKFSSLDDFPRAVQLYIVEIANGSAAAWIEESVPALQGRSILDFANEEGLQAAVDHLNKVASKISILYSLKLDQHDV